MSTFEIIMTINMTLIHFWIFVGMFTVAHFIRNLDVKVQGVKKHED